MVASGGILLMSKHRSCGGLRVAVPWSAALLVVGCAKVDVSIQQACADYTSVVRSREATCYDVAPEPNESTLVSREIESCALDSNALGSQVNAAYWEACAATADNGCQGYQCAQFPAGTRQAGEACLLSEQCASLFCKGVNVSDSSGVTVYGAIQCGACAPRLAEGDPCDVASDACEIGFSCFRSVCRKQGVQGEACAVWNDCALPTWVCKSSGVCDSVTADGQPCATQADCTTDTGCDVASGLCTPVTFGQPGAMCDGNVYRCEAGDCDTKSGVCPRIAPDGKACDPSDPSVVCDDYARCFRGSCQIPDPDACN
jgi:hypothetical protein